MTELNAEKAEQTPTISAAIVGYTNAGKSTLMNRLTNASVLAENKLFARRSHFATISNYKQKNLILIDTVGFIQKLPTHLIKAFYSTLEEVEADFLIHVIDAAHPCVLEYIKTSQHIIERLNAYDKPIIYVFNNGIG